MKRIQAACIMQTLRFQQTENTGLPVDMLYKHNEDELQRYKAQLDKNKTRYKIDEESKQPDGSIIVRIRKEYNGSADVGEYFS